MPSELPKGYDGYMLMYRLAQMFHCTPGDVATMRMSEALLWCDIDKYGGYMQKEYAKKLRARAMRDRG